MTLLATFFVLVAGCVVGHLLNVREERRDRQHAAENARIRRELEHHP